MAIEPQVTGMSALDDKLTQSAVKELCALINKQAEAGMSPQAVFNFLAHGVANTLASVYHLHKPNQQHALQIFGENVWALLPVWEQMIFNQRKGLPAGEVEEAPAEAPKKSNIILLN